MTAFEGASRAAAVESRETLVSVLFFVGSRVYKVKKPVALDFLDFSTPEARERACRREVELNRRLAPDVYLGVAELRGVGDEPPEHLVVMRRMPEHRRLATLVRAGGDVDACIRAVARVIAAFHARADTSPEIEAAGSPARVRANWESSFMTMAPFVGPVLDDEIATSVARLARRYLDGRAPLFERRVTQGAVRDGHGDLLADDIFCLDDGPRILDCIEFDDGLRYGDVLADVSFLAMDLERLGAPLLADRLLAWYAEFSGEHHPATLAHHYVAYRAHVRAKVACLQIAQGRVDVSAEAQRLLDLSYDHLRRARVALVLIGGLPASGKSTLAEGVGRALGWTVLRSDEIRKDREGVGHLTAHRAHVGQGMYSEASRDATYRDLLDRARSLLGLGEPVVLDASWTEHRWREAAHDLAAETHSDLVELHCVALLEVARARLAARAAAATGPSDATLEVLDDMAIRADLWPSAVEIDTTAGPARALEAALAAVRPDGSDGATVAE